jgi:hypothetical protein
MRGAINIGLVRGAINIGLIRGAINIGLVEGKGPLLVGGRMIGEVAIGMPRRRLENAFGAAKRGNWTILMPGAKTTGPSGAALT